MMIELKISGSLRERKNGLLELRTVQFGSVYGRTKEEIKEKVIKKLHEIQSHQKPKAKKREGILLSTFFKDIYLPYKKGMNLAKNTIEGIEYNFRFIMRCGFDKALESYTTADIEAFLLSIPETRKRQILQGLFNNMFKRAVARSLVKVNPCTAIEKMEHDVNKGTALSFTEQQVFFETIFASKRLSYVHVCYLIFVYLTGSRRNEALNLTISHVDWENKVLDILGTKTDGSERSIPLFPLVERLLRSLTPKNGRFFPFGEGKADEIFNVWETEHKLHDLRHTFGTIQICCNELEAKKVSLWMGHSNVETTLRIYTHPEQLDRGIFLRGDIPESEKPALLREKYAVIVGMIEKFLDERTQIVPKF